MSKIEYCAQDRYFSSLMDYPIEAGSLLLTSTLLYTINLFPCYLKKLTGYTYMTEIMENLRRE